MKMKRYLSVLLSVLMVCSIFGGLSVSAYGYDEYDTSHIGDASFLGASWTPYATADDMTIQADGI